MVVDPYSHLERSYIILTSIVSFCKTADPYSISETSYSIYHTSTMKSNYNDDEDSEHAELLMLLAKVAQLALVQSSNLLVGLCHLPVE